MDNALISAYYIITIVILRRHLNHLYHHRLCVLVPRPGIASLCLHTHCHFVTIEIIIVIVVVIITVIVITVIHISIEVTAAEPPAVACVVKYEVAQVGYVLGLCQVSSLRLGNKRSYSACCLPYRSCSESSATKDWPCRPKIVKSL